MEIEENAFYFDPNKKVSALYKRRFPLIGGIPAAIHLSRIVDNNEKFVPLFTDDDCRQTFADENGLQDLSEHVFNDVDEIARVCSMLKLRECRHVSFDCANGKNNRYFEIDKFIQDIQVPRELGHE